MGCPPTAAGECEECDKSNYDLVNKRIGLMRERYFRPFCMYAVGGTVAAQKPTEWGEGGKGAAKVQAKSLLSIS